ncbi:hypothetical protein NSMM_480049 [Nitrosomonas mobilis]|uniref:Uncharacterized protein n=1 Tax=Nitrosomonas mobilis TaxID=51642 RepID=A0A1G5SGC1_9PROT|nr:hypothetical protein NSMM_480049 [Nitrosomonas mobilis]
MVSPVRSCKCRNKNIARLGRPASDICLMSSTGSRWLMAEVSCARKTGVVTGCELDVLLVSGISVLLGEEADFAAGIGCGMGVGAMPVSNVIGVAF